MVLEPHCVYMLGFYFSFLAVAILILIGQYYKARGIKKMILLQIACMIGIMPLSLFWFSYGSITAFFANLVAIPLVGFIIVPLALIITFLGQWLIIPGTIPLLNYAVSFLIDYLNWIDLYENVNLNYSFINLISPLGLLLLMFFIFVFFIPRFNLIYCIIFAASLFPQFPQVKKGNAIVDILDVGKGLAISVRTAKNILIYDTGTAFPNHRDMSQLVIVPYLKQLGVKKINKVVLSHGDIDHRGGLQTLKTKLPY